MEVNVVDTKRRQPHHKVHVSLPADIFDRVERKSALAGAPFSTTLAEVVRRGLESEDQARLEEALSLDREENEAFATRVGPITAWVLGSEAAQPRR